MTDPSGPERATTPVPFTPSSVLVLRLWWEAGADEPLRARFVGFAGRDDGLVWGAAAAGRDDIITAVADWLDHFVAEVNR